jgi:hypothetical protein
MNSDNKWIVEHFEELVDTYGGSYIAVVDTTVAAIGDDPKEVKDEALANYPGRKPSILRVPREEDMVCLI